MEDAVNITICLFIIVGSIFIHELGHAIMFWLFRVKVQYLLIGYEIPWLTLSFRLPLNNLLDRIGISLAILAGLTRPNHKEFNRLSRKKCIAIFSAGVLMNYAISILLLLSLGFNLFDALILPPQLMLELPLYVGKPISEIVKTYLNLPVIPIRDAFPPGHWALRFALAINVFFLWNALPMGNSDGACIMAEIFRKPEK